MVQAVWIELPVTDIVRALAFYRAVFKLDEIKIADDGTRKTATLGGTGEVGATGVSLTQVPGFEPSGKRGIWLYLGTNDDFDGHVARVTAAGGEIVESNISMGEAGRYTSFLDTENNLLALYTYP